MIICNNNVIIKQSINSPVAADALFHYYVIITSIYIVGTSLFFVITRSVMGHKVD